MASLNVDIRCSEMKYISRAKLTPNIYYELNKNAAEKEGISIKGSYKRAVLEWVREKSGLIKKIPLSRCILSGHQKIYLRTMTKFIRIENDFCGYISFSALVNEKDEKSC